jgi:hypothetical protein
MEFIEIAKLLSDNANYNIDVFVWELVNKNRCLETERLRLDSENMELRATVNTLKEVIFALTHHEDKG